MTLAQALALMAQHNASLCYLGHARAWRLVHTTPDGRTLASSHPSVSAAVAVLTGGA